MPVTVAEGLIGFVVDLGKVDSALTAIQKGLSNLESSFTKISTKSAIITTTLTGIGLLSVKMAGNLETAMKRFELASKASGDELQKVNDQARELSGKFSSVEIVDAMTAMTKSGVDYATTMQKVGDIITFAKATNTDLITSIDLADKVIDLYGDSWSNLNKYLDLFAVATNTTELDIGGLTSVLRTAIPIGSAYGLGIQEIITIMARFTEAGADAGEAGMAFRKLLAFAADDADQLDRKLEKIGLTAKDVTIKSFEDLCSVVDKFNEKGVAATKIVDLFGARYGGPYIAHLITKGSDALRETAKKFDDVGGAAKKASDIYEGTFQRSWSRFQAQIKELTIELGERLLPTVNTVIRTFTDWIKIADSMSSGTKDSSIEWGKLAFSITATITAVAGLSKVVVSILALGAGTPLGAFILGGTIGVGIIIKYWIDYKEAVLGATDATKQFQKARGGYIESIQSEQKAHSELNVIIMRQKELNDQIGDQKVSSINRNTEWAAQLAADKQEYADNCKEILLLIQRIRELENAKKGTFVGPPLPEGYTPNQPGPSTGGTTGTTGIGLTAEEERDAVKAAYNDSLSYITQYYDYTKALGKDDVDSYINSLELMRNNAIAIYGDMSTQVMAIDITIANTRAAQNASYIDQLNAYSAAYISKAQIQFDNDSENYTAMVDLYTNMLDQKLVTLEEYNALMLELSTNYYIEEYGILTTMYENKLISTEEFYQQLSRLNAQYGMDKTKGDAKVYKQSLKDSKQYAQDILADFSSMFTMIANMSSSADVKVAMSFLNMISQIGSAVIGLIMARAAVATMSGVEKAAEFYPPPYNIAMAAIWIGFVASVLATVIGWASSIRKADTGGYFDEGGSFQPLKSGGHFRVNVLPGEMMIPKGMMPEVMDYYGGRTRSGVTITGGINLNISGVTDAGSFQNQIDSIADEVTKAIQRRIYLYQS